MILPDDVPLHPRVRQAVLEHNRDKPLTLNWKPTEPDAFDFLGLPKLDNPAAERAKRQLLSEALAAGERQISYSRHKGFYTHGQRRYRDTYTYRAILPAVDQLSEAGLLLHEKARPGSRGFQSRFCASPLLLAETPRVDVVYAPLEIIVVRDDHGRSVDYRDNRITRTMRRGLNTLNEALMHQHIALDGRAIREGDHIENGRAQIQMRRVFNRGSTDYGGRHYGPFWQNMGDRYRLGINGHPAVEVDYVAMHINMLYHEVGKQLNGDPYDLDGWSRDQAKIALLIVINAPSEAKAVQALADDLRLSSTPDPFRTAWALVKAVKARHPNIAYAFGSDAGVRLMRRDSDIAARVMLDVLRATGAVPLCVHDSFIVPAHHEGTLMEAMENALPCPTKTAKIPCGTATEIRDNYSSVNSKTSPDLSPQYGTGGGTGLEAGLEPDGPGAGSGGSRPFQSAHRLI